MAKVHSLKIKNFRGIKELEYSFGIVDFICLIGRGDSGKSTILDAISFVLSPNWNLHFYDTDFFNCDVENPIQIEASLYDLPKALIVENKYGLYVRGLNKVTNEIHDTLEDGQVPILTLRLTVRKDLEPCWCVVNERENQDDIEIKSTDRAKFNVFLISDYFDRHFSWNRGNPLYSLLQEEEMDVEAPNILINAIREAKEKIDSSSFEHLEGITNRIKESAKQLGIDISKTSTTIDIKEIFIKDEKVCLHEEKVPFRLKGKGSKRLISLAIQTELAKAGGIFLIDELEHGLEPDRAQFLARTLKKNNTGQIFITTHSRDVLVELNATDLFRLKKNPPQISRFNLSMQGCIRFNPESFFSDRVIVCEGLTEIGIFRSIERYRISQGKISATFKGVRYANGGGTNQIEYAKSFAVAGYEVCLFCDSNIEEINSKKEELRKLGVSIIDWDKGKSIENHVFEELPWDGIKELIEHKTQDRGEVSIEDSVRTKYGTLAANWKDVDSLEMRNAICAASLSKTNEWFKKIDHGEFLGSICCKYLSQMAGKKLATQIEAISKWVENV